MKVYNIPTLPLKVDLETKKVLKKVAEARESLAELKGVHASVFYTKIEFLQEDLKVTRQTASKYLDILAQDENRLLEKIKIGRDNYYINAGLMQLFSQYDYKL